MNKATAFLSALSVYGLAFALPAQTFETHDFPGINKLIPDGNASGLHDVRTVNSTIGSLKSVRVQLQVQGEFNGDLYGYVRHVHSTGTNFCVLLNRAGRKAANSWGYADSGMSVVFDGNAVGDIHNYRSFSVPATGAPLTGSWQPDGRSVDPSRVLDTTPRTTSLSSFAGSPASGEWTLYLVDFTSGATNMLRGWRLELEPASSNEVVLDNATASDVTYVGTWTESTSTPGYWGVNYRHDGNAAKGSKSAKFTPTLAAGAYQVFFWYPAKSTYANNVPVDVVHAGGTTTVMVNQQANGGMWNLLGTYSFNAGTGGYVRVRTTGTVGYVIADAVKFVPVTLPTVTVAATDATAGEPGSGAGSGTFTFSRTSPVAAPLTVNYTVGGTATGGSDYTALATAVTFAAGAATATRTVSVLEDALVEGNETVVVTLASGSGYTVGSPASATVTIQDDDPSGCTEVALVTGFSPGAVRNDAGGWRGHRLKVGASALEVRQLGRVYLNGNAQNHELRLVRVSDKAVMASVVWSPAGGVHGQMKYVPLAAAVSLAANTEYYLVSQEYSGGDSLYSFNTTLSTTTAATVLSAIYSTSGTTWSVPSSGTGSLSYGPVGLVYCDGQGVALPLIGDAVKGVRVLPAAALAPLPTSEPFSPNLSITTDAEGKIFLEWPTLPGAIYIVESASGSTTTWEPIYRTVGDGTSAALQLRANKPSERFRVLAKFNEPAW